jgi:MFS family permease
VRPLALIVLLCLLVFSNTVSIGAFPALLPEIGRAGGLADWQLGALAGAFGFARMLADIPIGLFVTRDLRRALVLSPVLLSAGVLLLASAGPLPVLVLGRAVMGLGQALGLIGGLTAILRYQATGRLASALGAFEFSAMVGMLAATVALGLLPTTLSWNVALLLTSAPQFLGLALIPALLAAVPAERAATGAPFKPWRGGADPARRVTAGVVLAFVAGGVIALAYSTLEQFLIPLRGDREFGLTRNGIAQLLMTVQLFDIACLLPVGALADRYGTPRVLGLMLLVFGSGAALVAFGDFPALVVGCALFGLGLSAWTLPLSVLRGETPPEHVGWRTGLYRVGVDGGIFLGPFVSGLITVWLPAFLPGVLTVLLLGTGLIFVGWSLSGASRPAGAAGRR